MTQNIGIGKYTHNMDSQEIEQYASMLADKDISEISAMIDVPFGPIMGAIFSPGELWNVIISPFLRLKVKKVNSLKQKCTKECEEQIDKNKVKIEGIIKKGNKSTNCIVEIVQLIAPAVAQTIVGLPGLVIVGTIIILVKQKFFVS